MRSKYPLIKIKNREIIQIDSFILVIDKVKIK